MKKKNINSRLSIKLAPIDNPEVDPSNKWWKIIWMFWDLWECEIAER